MPRSGRPHEGHEFAHGHVERDVRLQDGDGVRVPAIRLGDVADLYDGIGHWEFPDFTLTLTPLGGAGRRRNPPRRYPPRCPAGSPRKSREVPTRRDGHFHRPAVGHDVEHRLPVSLGEGFFRHRDHRLRVFGGLCHVGTREKVHLGTHLGKHLRVVMPERDFHLHRGFGPVRRGDDLRHRPRVPDVGIRVEDDLARLTDGHLREVRLGHVHFHLERSEVGQGHHRRLGQRAARERRDHLAHVGALGQHRAVEGRADDRVFDLDPGRDHGRRVDRNGRLDPEQLRLGVVVVGLARQVVLEQGGLPVERDLGVVEVGVAQVGGWPGSAPARGPDIGVLDAGDDLPFLYLVPFHHAKVDHPPRGLGRDGGLQLGHPRTRRPRRGRWPARVRSGRPGSGARRPRPPGSAPPGNP